MIHLETTLGRLVGILTPGDITRGVLTQIIFEEENKGTNLLPINQQVITMKGNFFLEDAEFLEKFYIIGV